MKQFEKMSVMDLRKLYEDSQTDPQYAQKVIESIIKEEKENARE